MGGCQDGVDGDDFARRQRARRQNTADLFGDEADTEQMAEAMQKSSSRGRGDVEESHGDESAHTDAANVKMAPPGPRKRIISLVGWKFSELAVMAAALGLVPRVPIVQAQKTRMRK